MHSRAGSIPTFAFEVHRRRCSLAAVVEPGRASRGRAGAAALVVNWLLLALVAASCVVRFAFVVPLDRGQFHSVKPCCG